MNNNNNINNSIMNNNNNINNINNSIMNDNNNINNSISNNNSINKTKLEKHILFFSNFCEFSNNIYKKIEKLNIKNNFIMINISQNKFKIPSNITSVPTILLNDKKTILQEDDIDNFLEKIYNKLNTDIDPYINVRGISDNFSFLDDNNNEKMSTIFGSTKDVFRIITPPEDSEKNTSSITDRMNNMQQNRNSDIKNIFNKNN